MTTAYYEIASYHSIIRAKERIGYNEKTSMNQIKHALKRGKRAEQFASKERTYLEDKCDENTHAVAYNNFCYIVSDTGICITVFALPTWFGKKKHYDGKEQIRNAKAYLRYNSYEDSEVWA